MLNIFTVDLEEWFHINDSKWLPYECWDTQTSRVEENTLRLLAVLARYEVKSTFFVMGWVAEKFPRLLEYICKEGHSIGYHSYYHDFPMNQQAERFEEDLVKGVEVIKFSTGYTPCLYRAPNLSLNKESLYIIPILLQHGFKTSSSIRSGREINGAKIPLTPFKWSVGGKELLEMPVNRLSIFGKYLSFSGSGYFRLNPYILSKHFFAKFDFNVAYFHPNDVDYLHPKHAQLGWLRNWMNVVGTKGCEKKIARLLDDFLFTDLESASMHYLCKNDLKIFELKL